MMAQDTLLNDWHRDLTEETVAVDDTWDSRYFVPLDGIERLVTEQRIEAITGQSVNEAFGLSLKVIAILLEIGQHTKINQWLNAGLRDSHLPVEHDREINALVPVDREGNDEAFRPCPDEMWLYSSFIKNQWDFLAPVFKSGNLEITKVGAACPLPIMNPAVTSNTETPGSNIDQASEESDQGAFGIVDKVTIHYAHVDPRLVGSSQALVSRSSHANYSRKRERRHS
jgi:hypothetical protein